MEMAVTQMIRRARMVYEAGAVVEGVFFFFLLSMNRMSTIAKISTS